MAWFIVFPFTASTECHRRHHRYLGDPDHDPDDWHYTGGRRGITAHRHLRRTLHVAVDDALWPQCAEVLRELVSIWPAWSRSAPRRLVRRAGPFRADRGRSAVVLTMHQSDLARLRAIPDGALGDRPTAVGSGPQHHHRDQSYHRPALANINSCRAHVYPRCRLPLPKLHRLLQDRSYQRDPMLLSRVLRGREADHTDRVEPDASAAATTGEMGP